MRWMMRAGSNAKLVLHACVWVGAVLTGMCCPAQQAQQTGTKDQTPVFTLKVYTDLVQVPTLVLDHDRQSLPPIDASRFQVSLDGGKKFAPTHVRLEGEDPLNVAIVFDVGMKQRSELVPGFADAVAAAMAKMLHPQDRISIYLLSCNLIRTVHQVVPDAELLRGSIEEGLQSPMLGKDRAGVTCGPKVYLFGAATTVVTQMRAASGRRAILMISVGQDDGIATSKERLHDYAIVDGVALFGLTDLNDAWIRGDREPKSEFVSLCESTGGIVMEGNKRDLQKRLTRWIGLLRGRYIVEFPRPQTLNMGANGMDITIRRDGLAFTTFAGVSVSLPDPMITSDPHYVPSQLGADIPVGTRRPTSH